MPKVIIFGDIDIAPLYISIDGAKELVVSGKWPRCIHVEAGPHHIAATSVTKTQRAMRTPSNDFLGMAANALTDGANTSLAGTVELDSDDVLLFQVKQSLTKTNVYNQVVDTSEAGQYVDMDAVLNFGERAPGEKNKWAVFFLCLFFGWFGVHRFYEKKIGTGILYLLTFGLCGIGVLHDLFQIWRRTDLFVLSEDGTTVRRSFSGKGVAAILIVLLIVLVWLDVPSLLMGVTRNTGEPVPSSGVQETETPAEETPEADPLYQNDGFIFPNSDSELIDQWEIETLSDQDLTYAINEIYARHGYIFRSAELSEYYGQFSWYAGEVPSSEFSVDCFNQIEQQNWNLLVNERNFRKAAD